jgi:ankyrin repeat protein
MGQDESLAAEAVRCGDVDGLKNLLGANPALATARIDGKRTLLHAATDWPGHFPNGPAIVVVLIEAGAEVNAPFTGNHEETPLHWAASSDDVPVLDTLLDRGANIEVMGSVIDGGSPLADAVAFGQWNAARRLVERGARTTIWQAAALGIMADLEAHLAAQPSRDEITNAFWCACHGGQRGTAEVLLTQGADLHWVGYDGLTPIDAANRSHATELVEWLRSQ